MQIAAAEVFSASPRTLHQSPQQLDTLKINWQAHIAALEIAAYGHRPCSMCDCSASRTHIPLQYVLLLCITICTGNLHVTFDMMLIVNLLFLHTPSAAWKLVTDLLCARERWFVLKIPRSDTNEVGEYEITVTSEPHA